MKLESEVTGLDTLGEVLIRVEANAKEQTRHIIEHSARSAEAVMLAKVPRSNSGNRDTIAASIRSVSEYHPGGAGGGGFYEARVGPGEDAPGHLRYVMEGTGLFGSGSLIRSASGGVLAIEKRGEGVHFRTFSRGQRAQTQWYDDAIQAAELSMETGVRTANFNINLRR